MKFDEQCRFMGNTEVAICFNGEFYHAKVLKNPTIRAIGKTMDEAISNLEIEMKRKKVA